MKWRTKQPSTQPAVDLSAACEAARRLVGDGYLGDAIAELQKAAEAANSKISLDLIALKGRLSTADSDRRGGRKTPDEATVERNLIREQLLASLEELKNGPPQQATDVLFSRKELEARRDYLAEFKKDITARLKVSIHNARMIDLGLTDTPGAVAPWGFRDTATLQSFENYDDAIEHHNRRVLVLGAPGSGKSITLLHFAQKLIAEAEADMSAPIPMWVNLSKFVLKPSAQSTRWPARQARTEPADESKRIEQWLVEELARNPLVTTEIAGRWISEGRIAALMDGLDEVDDEYRAGVAALLNATYLRQHPKSVVVVCSRINEYKTIEEDKAAKLELQGSITLEPLTRPQISQYLEESKAIGLRDALFNDDTLYQMAQTPLMLSMLTLSYAGLELNQVPSSGSPIDRRHQLMETYVGRMLQRQMRRVRGIVVDNNPKNDVPVSEYPYAPDRLNHYLGWLAVRLSVRMQTAFSPPRLCSFLQREIVRDRWFGVWWAGAFARAPLLAILAICGGLALAPMERPAWQLVLLLAVSAMLIYPMVAWSFRSEASSSSTDITNTASRPRLAAVAVGLAMITAATTFAGGFCVGSLALSMVLQGVPPIAIGVIAICLTIFLAIGAYIVADGDYDDEGTVFVVGTAIVVGLEIGWRWIGMPAVPGDPRWNGIY